MTLIPPKVCGPLSFLSTSIRVEHVLPGAWVEILVNGSPIQRTNIATSNAVEVPLLGYTMPPGGTVTARWSLGGEASLPSVPEIVLGYPTKLGNPFFLSPIHTCVDWIAVGGLYPGATVEIRNGGNLVGGPDSSNGATTHVRIHGSISPGDRLNATQIVQVPNLGAVQSHPANSLAAEDWFPREDVPQTPVVIGPIHECAGAVLVGGAVPGCFLHLHSGGTELEYAAVAADFWALLPGEAHAPATFAASSHLRRCGRQSGVSPVVGVDPAAPLRTPTLKPDTQYCPSGVSVTAEALTPRSALTFELRGASGTTVLGRAGAPDNSPTDSYWLGDLSSLVPASPPYPAVVLTEQLCALSAESNLAGIHRQAGQQDVPPAFFRRPTECSRWLHVLNAWGCLVTVRSDAADWPILAFWTLVPNSGWIYLNRPLRGGEQVWVTIEAGCIPAHLLTSDKTGVDAVGDLDNLRIDEPLRPGHNRVVWIEHAIPGGRVHVFVNGKLRTSVWAIGSPTESMIAVPVGELTDESQVTARQEMCGKIGRPSPTVWAKRGRMHLEADPSSVTRGQASAVTIRARDIDFGFEMTGLPINGPSGHVGYTGQPFTVTAAAGTASPIHFTVDTEGYDQGSVDVPIAAPAPPPQAVFTITSMSAIGVQNQVITEIEWTLMGGGQSIKRDQKPNTTSCVLTIPLPTPPAGSTVTYNLSGKATIEFIQPLTGAKLTRQVTVFSVFNGLQGSIVVAWEGTARSAEINISWRPIYDPQTGHQIDEVYCFVLNKMA
jgi:hypothetical protein